MTFPIFHLGECIATMRAMPDASVDSIVTDPPYELGFMGKSWDASGIAYSVEMWREALRVLKPGGHLLAFSGSRTYHRMTCAIEDAGFEIRDQIMWVYGSGFPKSLDVSKAIDKAGGDALAWRAFSAAYAAAVEASSLNHSDVDRALGVKSSSCYWARTDNRGGMPPRHHWEQVRAMLSLPAEFARLYDEAEREVVGHRDRGLSPGSNQVYGEYSGDTRITAPATDAARQWQGWGTALKPAHEPICVARKLLIGTVAANVLAFGTGAINVDGCRVGSEERSYAPKGTSTNAAMIRVPEHRIGKAGSEVTVNGRWPANLIHDGSDEVLTAFPEGAGANGGNGSFAQHAWMGGETAQSIERSKGSAARFFYCAKTSKSDRGAENTHPTVKPTDLMRYLCRLVTPPGGLVLDPFTGSGSTGKAAVLEGFRFVGCELSPEYIEIARARVTQAWMQANGFGALAR